VADNGGRWAKVVAVHPEARAVDIVYLDNGGRVPMVQVLCDTCSTNTGDFDLPEPTAGPEPYSFIMTKDRDVLAAVISFGGLPAVIGFKVPEVCQMTFKRKNFRVNRHASDVYSTIDDDGNFELAFPNGTFMRFAATPAHEDLTGQDFDGRWKITRNVDKALHFQLAVHNGGVQTAALHIDPTGHVTLSAETLSMLIVGAITSSASAWNHTGPVNISGDVGITGTATASVDVIGGGKHLKTHTHLENGAGSQTAAPT
jgi:hypothetical protein